MLNSASKTDNQAQDALLSLAESLPQMKNNMATLFDIVPTALLVVDGDSTITVWNAEMEKVTGFLAKDVRGQFLKEVLPQLATHCEKLEEGTGSRKRLETVVQHREGHSIPIGFSASRLSPKDAVPNGVVIIARNISEQMRRDALFQALSSAGRKAALAHTAEQAFSAMSNELSALSIWSLVIKLDSEGKNLNLRHIELPPPLNPTSSALGPEQEFLLEELMQSSAPIENMPYFLEMCQSEQTIFVEQYWSTEAGISFPALVANFLQDLPFPCGTDVIMSPLWEERKVVGLLMVGGAIRADDLMAIGSFANQLSAALANVELWKNMEKQIVQRSERLHQEQMRLNVILKAMTDAVIFTDAEERIRYVNPAWEKLNGYLLDEVYGEKSNIIASAKTAESTRQSMARAAIHGQYFEGELVNKRKDGSTYEVYITMVPVHDEKGELEYFVGVLRDISTEKRMARTQEKFVAEMSHDLLTPLTNIQLYISLLQKGNTEHQQKYLATLKRESKRLHRLIENLLSISLHDRGRFDFSPTVVDLNEFLRRLVDDRAELAQSSNISLEFAPLQDIPLVMADPSLLEEVAANLLTNAISYSQSMSVILITPCQQRHDGNGWVGFSVTDSGYGITEEEQPLIFDRFFRGTASHALNGSGTGLGLSLCKQIIDRHGGRIDVKSKPNVGSTFTVWLKV